MLDVIFSNYFEIDKTEYFVTRWPLSHLAELVYITFSPKMRLKEWHYSFWDIVKLTQEKCHTDDNAPFPQYSLWQKKSITSGMSCIFNNKGWPFQVIPLKTFQLIPYFSVIHKIYSNSPQNNVSIKNNNINHGNRYLRWILLKIPGS